MAGTVQFFGGATGLPADLIDRLMEVEKSRLNKIQANRQATATQQSSFDTLSSKLLSLKSKAEDLQDSTSWTPHSASSSDEDMITITASSEATAANHYVEVSRLATHNSLMLGIGGVDGNNPGTGITTAQDDTGLTNVAPTFTFDYNGDGYTVAAATGDSLQDIADKINALDYGDEEGVSASVIYDGTYRRLVMSAKDSGAQTRDGAGNTTASRISITGMNLEFGAATVAAADMMVTEAGVDAKMKVDGLANVYSSSNTVNDVIAGVTMELKGLTTSAVTLSITNDNDAAKTTLQGFVDTYNDVIDYINSKKTSDFSGEAAIRGALSQIRMELNTPTDGVVGSFEALSQLGVETNAQSGKLSIDTDKFDDAVAADFNSLKEIFTKEPAAGNKGLAFRLETLLDNLTDSHSGLIPGKSESLGTKLDRLDDNIDRENRRLEQVRKRLTAKYAKLEQTVTMLNGSASAMSSALSRM
ncbi:MAG: flagellar filament capping protein FliD [Magnetococcales bacterium]|nr:flagellar filament capping protein FliD [Magnetococcales bacterium]NGZ26466.1 flagellar filament capping protein FliD [Magnetococcales bacterium]